MAMTDKAGPGGCGATGPTADVETDLDLDLDLKGLKCPLPVLKTRKAMGRLAEGARVRVVSTDPMSVIDIPHYCSEAGHRLLSQAAEDGTHVFLIERGA